MNDTSNHQDTKRLQHYHPMLIQSDKLAQSVVKTIFEAVDAHRRDLTVDDLHIVELFDVPVVGEMLVDAATMSQRAMARALGHKAWMEQQLLAKNSETLIKRCMTDPGVHFVWQHYRWLRSGRRIYDVGHDLAVAMANTRISAPGSAIAGGLPTAYFALPRGLFTLHKHGLAGNTQACDGIYVTEMPLEHGDRVLIVLVVAVMDFVESPISAPAFQFSIPLRKDEQLESLLDAEGPRFHAFLGPNAENVAGLLRLVCGLNLLIQGDARNELVKPVQVSTPPSPALQKAIDTAGRKKGAELLKAHKDKVRYQLWRVGEGYELQGAVKTATGGRTVDVRSLVRGHFRHQAHGPGRTERKMIWIQPHWRGADLPVSTTTTVVKMR